MSSFSPTFAVIPFILLLLLDFSSVCALWSPDLTEGDIRLPSAKAASGVGFCKGTHEQPSCPVKCFRADPVCGDDGITYWCGCTDALCHGVRIVKQGACDVGNGVSLSVPGQALLLIHIVWLILLGFSMLFGLF